MAEDLSKLDEWTLLGRVTRLLRYYEVSLPPDTTPDNFAERLDRALAESREVREASAPAGAMMSTGRPEAEARRGLLRRARRAAYRVSGGR